MTAATDVDHYDERGHAYGMVNGQCVRLCTLSVSDGNQDDPTYAYCGCPHGHAGEHEYVIR